jgi:glycosyltransferase involved in cell wall biosynthesis
VLEQADKVIAVGWHMQKELMTKGAKQVSVITNGYDEEDFKTSQVMDDQKDEEFVLMHLGSINKDRNPDHFWKALSTLCGENPVFASRLKIKLVGTIDYLVEDSIKKYKLDTRLEKVDYIPHAEVSAHLQAASLLLLFLNNTPNVDGILTGKLFEYLASGRRVLCIGSSQGDAAKVIEQCQAGASFGFSDEKGMKSFLEREFDHFQKGMEQGVDLAEVKKFSRKQLTEDLDKLMKGLTANKA